MLENNKDLSSSILTNFQCQVHFPRNIFTFEIDDLHKNVSRTVAHNERQNQSGKKCNSTEELTPLCSVHVMGFSSRKKEFSKATYNSLEDALICNGEKICNLRG